MYLKLNNIKIKNKFPSISRLENNKKNNIIPDTEPPIDIGNKPARIEVPKINIVSKMVISTSRVLIIKKFVKTEETK